MQTEEDRTNEVGCSLLELNHLLTISELSRYLSVPISTIRSWMYKGKIPYVKFGDGKRSIVRFNPRIISGWIERIQKEPQLELNESLSSLSNEKVEITSNKTISEFDNFIKNLKEAAK